jgi:hypothetical protein
MITTAVERTGLRLARSTADGLARPTRLHPRLAACGRTRIHIDSPPTSSDVQTQRTQRRGADKPGFECSGDHAALPEKTETPSPVLGYTVPDALENNC